MANCKKCGVYVGCNCNLINGMCVYCNGLVSNLYLKIKKYVNF